MNWSKRWNRSKGKKTVERKTGKEREEREKMRNRGE